MSQLIATCTGHRPQRLPWGFDQQDPRCLQLKQTMAKEMLCLYQQGYNYFISGMALGTDLYFAQLVLELQELHPEIQLECAIPCPSQSNHWSKPQQDQYNHILDRANYETLVQHFYSKGCMMRRNRYMVDRSSAILCVYDGIPKGGTAQTIHYARQQGKEVIMMALPQKETP